VVEEDARPPRLVADAMQRHVAGAEIEVRGERSDAAQRRPDAGLLLLDALRRSSDRASVCDALAVGAVTRDAVLAVQVLALRARQDRDGDGQRDGRGPLHDCLHAMSTIEATPSSRTMTR